jgi:hypothetical protein
MISDETGIREIFPGDWFLFDELNTISYYPDLIFQSEFLRVPNLETRSSLGSRPFPIYQRRHHVVAEQIFDFFVAYADTSSSHGNPHDFLVQDNFPPFYQTTVPSTLFNKYFHEISEGEKNNYESEEFVSRNSYMKDEMKEPLPPSLQSRPSRTSSRSHRDQIRLVKEGKNLENLEKNCHLSKVYRHRTGTFCFGIPIHASLTIWKCDSGQGGRCQGYNNDLAIFHSTGDFEGFFSSTDLFQYFRYDTFIFAPLVHDEVKDHPPPAPSSASAVTSTWSTDLHQICSLIPIFEVLALQLSQPTTALCCQDRHRHTFQFGNSGDYLVQAIFPPPLVTPTVVLTDATITTTTQNPLSSPSSPHEQTERISQWILSASQFHKQFISLNPPLPTIKPPLPPLPQSRPSSLKETEQLQQYPFTPPPTVRRVASLPPRVETTPSYLTDSTATSTDNESPSNASSTTTTTHTITIDGHTSGVNVFDQYQHTLKCWSGSLQRRSRFLRQWQKKYYELYPDRFLIYKDPPPSPSGGAGAVPGTGGHLDQHSSLVSIDLKYCVVHSVIIDDKPVIYLGNAKASDEGETKPLPLEMYAVTSTSERWESRYQKLTRLSSGASAPHPNVTTIQLNLPPHDPPLSHSSPPPSSSSPSVDRDRGSFTATVAASAVSVVSSPSAVVKSIQNFSYSNANGIFLMASDPETHALLIYLLRECILFCRRVMAFQAASSGDIDKLLEVLCSVSPDDANRILLSPKDAHSGKLILHEAASSSCELLKILLSIGEDTFEHSNTSASHLSGTSNSGGGNLSMIRHTVMESSFPSSFLFLSPAMTCHDGLNCLHYAVLADNFDTVKYLLDTPSTSSTFNTATTSPLNTSESLFQLNIDCQTSAGHTPLHFSKSSNMTTYLLSHGANPIALDNEGRAPLMMMASFGNTAALTRLIRDVSLEVIDINRQSWKTGYTALVLACLLLGGIHSPHHTPLHNVSNNHTANTPQNLSHFSQTATLIGLLLYYGADPNIPDTQNNNCLHHICTIYRAGCSDTSTEPHRKQFITQQLSTCVQMVRLLVQYGCSKVATNLKGHIPLTIVCQSKKYTGEGLTVDDVLEPLIYGKQIHNLPTQAAGVFTPGTSPCAKCPPLPSTSPLLTSTRSSSSTDPTSLIPHTPTPPTSTPPPTEPALSAEDIANLLLKFRVDGTSCVHFASQVGNSQLLHYLLSKGADPNLKDKLGYTSLDIIQNKLKKVGHSITDRQREEMKESVRVLCQHGASSRLRADLPVEQDTSDMKFIRNASGGYSVKSASVDAIIHRLCVESSYVEEDAKAISLCYQHLVTDTEFLKKIIKEFKILVHYESNNSHTSETSRGRGKEKRHTATSPKVDFVSPGSTTTGVVLSNQECFDFSAPASTSVNHEGSSELPTHESLPMTKMSSMESVSLKSMKIVVRKTSHNETTITSLSDSSNEDESDSDSDSDRDDSDHSFMTDNQPQPLGGLFSFVMVWMNTCQEKIGEELFSLPVILFSDCLSLSLRFLR